LKSGFQDLRHGAALESASMSSIPKIPAMGRIRLTEFSHGGGCGCKIAPAILAEQARCIGRLDAGTARLNFS